MQVIAWALGPVEETEAQRARRLHAFLTFYGPGGFATPDDVAALELAQQGYAAWREVPWTDLSRGMGNSQEQLATDEGHLRVFWRKWERADGGAAHEQAARSGRHGDARRGGGLPLSRGRSARSLAARRLARRC